MVEHGKVYQIFQSGLSPRYLKGQVLSDSACGLAVRSFFTVAEETLPTGRQFLYKFIMLGAYIPCPGGENGSSVDYVLNRLSQRARHCGEHTWLTSLEW